MVRNRTTGGALPPQGAHLLCIPRTPEQWEACSELNVIKGAACGDVELTRRLLVRSPGPPSGCRGVPEQDASPYLLQTCWLSPCVVDSAVGVWMCA